MHVWANYPDAWLDMRSRVDDTGWVRVCRLPCDRRVFVDGREARVRAKGMTTSNAFSIEPGKGTARISVSGGSADDRHLGKIALSGGIPTVLGGGILFGYGEFKDVGALRTTGIVTMVVGTAAILVSLPLLTSGATTVRDKKRQQIARLATGRVDF